jgi:hypothetical protein
MDEPRNLIKTIEMKQKIIRYKVPIKFAIPLFFVIVIMILTTVYFVNQPFSDLGLVNIFASFGFLFFFYFKIFWIVVFEPNEGVLYRNGIVISESINRSRIRGKRKFVSFNEIKSIKFVQGHGSIKKYIITLNNGKSIMQEIDRKEEVKLIQRTHANYLQNN